MGALLGLSRGIDHVNLFIGRCVSWLVLAAVLISAGNAIVRKLFNTSSNAWLEAQWYLFGGAFMLAAAMMPLFAVTGLLLYLSRRRHRRLVRQPVGHLVPGE